jgi:hypothetical protein
MGKRLACLIDKRSQEFIPIKLINFLENEVIDLINLKLAGPQWLACTTKFV